MYSRVTVACDSGDISYLNITQNCTKKHDQILHKTDFYTKMNAVKSNCWHLQSDPTLPTGLTVQHKSIKNS